MSSFSAAAKARFVIFESALRWFPSYEKRTIILYELYTIILDIQNNNQTKDYFFGQKRDLSKKSYKKTVKCKNRTSLRICPMHGRKEIDYNIKWSRLELQSGFG